jgi:tRNA(adenine34) deaminase
MPSDDFWMQVALAEARVAASLGDVPVGCVLVSAEQRYLSSGRNVREATRDPIGHAELIALQAARDIFLSWRIENVTAYVTLEPCVMCAGALVNARVTRVVFGCLDPKAGAISSKYAIGRDGRLNHTFDLTPRVREQVCSDLLKRFYASVRRRGRTTK